MSTDVHIKYVNNSNNPDNSKVIIFTKNALPIDDAVTGGVAWKAIPKTGKGSSTHIVYPIDTYIQAMWGDGSKTPMISAVPGRRYTLEEDNTGIILGETGPASQADAIEVSSMVHVSGGISAQIVKDGRVLMTKDIAAYGQKAVFILHPKLYWGIASDIHEGEFFSSTDLHNGQSWEQDIEGVNNALVTLHGNPQGGYNFSFEKID